VRTRDRVIDALRDARAVGISGELVAQTLGISRVAVSKHVAALRELGYTIEAVPGTGYRLLSVPDLALPGEVQRLVTNPFWRRFEGGFATGSTNDDARGLAREGADEGTVVVAGSQSAGRGRMGRSWSSPAGGAYFSAVLRPLVAPSQASALSLVVALGIARGLEGMGVTAELKWPNDLQLQGSKLAGVLLEMSAESDRVEWIVAGAGINVVRPSTPVAAAAYLSDTAAEVGATHAVAAALDGLATAYAVWSDSGFSALREDYERRLVLIGREVVVSDLTGAVRASGTVRGVDDEGRLLVSGASGVESVAAGEVTLRR
jgi:BirA family biotin operon repressor/biotin-[acetyl-CoA-carboxylase] ligase